MLNKYCYDSAWGVGKERLLIESPILATSTWDLKYMVTCMD